MTSPDLMRRLGIRDPETIASEMQQAMQQKTMMEESVAGRGTPAEKIPASASSIGRAQNVPQQ